MSEKLLDVIRNDFKSWKSRERRSYLISDMSLKNDSGVDCLSCSGTCCTYVANSMQITPIETLELYFYLEENNRINESLINQLRKNINEFRLDKEISLGKGQVLRRNYTCPFFNEGPKGCSISRGYKPYGCLAFNPYEKNQKQGGNCKSDSELLEKREEDNKKEEDIINEKLLKSLNLYWEKRSIPWALAEVIEKLRGD